MLKRANMDSVILAYFTVNMLSKKIPKKCALNTSATF
jgi:hypothetical protein